MWPILSRESGARPEDLAACKALLCQGSRSFYAASFLLPERVREPACALYAFCRLADDAIDLAAPGSDALAALQDRLDRAYRGEPLALPADRAFAAVVGAWRMPRRLPEALLEGFAWDAENRRYQTLEELTAYAARVAGTVGAMMAVLMDVRDTDALARACDLGVAMQFSNIARDVGEDARAHRLYLPLDWLIEVGIDPDAWLADPRFTPELGSVVARLLAHADMLYRRAESGLALLPRACRPGINAARVLYAEIGHEVARLGWDSISVRAHVSGMRKLGLVALAIAGSAHLSAGPRVPPLAACAFLVEAARTVRPEEARPLERPVRWWNLHGRWVWAIGLFERLERLERVGQLSSTL